MDFDKIMEVLKALLTNPIVIITAVVCAILLKFVNYIYKYQKKPPKKNIKKSVAAPAAPAEETASSDGGDGDDDGEE